MALPEFYIFWLCRHNICDSDYFLLYIWNTCNLNIIHQYMVSKCKMKPRWQYTFARGKDCRGCLQNTLLAFSFDQLKRKILPLGQQKRLLSVTQRSFSLWLRALHHNLSNSPSLGDVLQTFSFTVTIYRMGETADCVGCYMHMVVCFECMWRTWGLFWTIQTALLYVLWTWPWRKLFPNNSRQNSEMFLISNGIRKKKKPQDIQTPFFFSHS